MFINCIVFHLKSFNSSNSLNSFNSSNIVLFETLFLHARVHTHLHKYQSINFDIYIYIYIYIYMCVSIYTEIFNNLLPFDLHEEYHIPYCFFLIF